MSKSPFSESISHESFGAIQISRASYSNGLDQTKPRGAALFMSAHRHEHILMLSISTAKVSRDLSQDHFFGGGEMIVEVMMSEAQFAQAITGLNIGGGTPCTIAYRQRGPLDQMAEPPASISKPPTYAQEIEDTVTASASRLREIIDRVKGWLKPKSKPPSRAEFEAILRNLEMSHRDTTSSVGFVARQFEEAQDKIIAHGKAELEAHAMAGLKGIALAAIRDSIPPEQREALMKSISTAIGPPADANEDLGRG